MKEVHLPELRDAGHAKGLRPSPDGIALYINLLLETRSMGRKLHSKMGKHKFSVQICVPKELDCIP